MYQLGISRTQFTTGAMRSPLVLDQRLSGNVAQCCLDDFLRNDRRVAAVYRPSRIFALRPKSVDDETDVTPDAALARIFNSLWLAAEVRGIGQGEQIIRERC